jgi:two-component system, sensor histidine kinase
VREAGREDAIARARMRLYFTEYAASARFGVRPLQFALVIGAVVIGAVLHVLAGTPVGRIAVWCAGIAAGEAAIVVINHMFLVRQPADAELPHWARAKAMIAGFGGFALGLGQVLLYVRGEALTAIVPPWTIMMYCCGAVWAGAFYAPALFAMLLSSTLPAAIWLLTGEGVELVTGLCLLIAIPYFMVIGRSASLRYRAAVIDKIDIALLLEKQRADTARIEKLGAERTRFFSAASHDLRQPLHAMGLYLALLRDNPKSAERDELIDNVAQCAASLDAQFNAILGVNETAKLIAQAAPAAVPLQEIVDRIIVQARPRAAEKGLDLRVMATTAWAMVAPDILARVLGNLVSNAVRYTPAGGVLVGVRRRGGDCAIMVVDTGVGIAPENQAEVFEDFFQVENPERSSAPGFGLGLGIVRRFCDGMGWKLELNSRPGRGTSFAVVVPATAPVARKTPALAPEARASRLQGRRALVLDDDERVRDAMRRMLERWGVEAEFCTSPVQAFALMAQAERAEDWRLLVDYRLGGDMSGLDFVEETRRRYGDRFQAALVTGEADPALEARAESLGLAILRKPVQAVRLRALLAR